MDAVPCEHCANVDQRTKVSNIYRSLRTVLTGRTRRSDRQPRHTQRVARKGPHRGEPAAQLGKRHAYHETDIAPAYRVRRESRRFPVGANPTRPIGRSDLTVQHISEMLGIGKTTCHPYINAHHPRKQKTVG